MYRLRSAHDGDLAPIDALVRKRSDRLAQRGISSLAPSGYGLTGPDRAAAELLVLTEDERVIACTTLIRRTPQTGWTLAQRAEPAMALTMTVTDPDRVDTALAQVLTCWFADYATRHDYTWVRCSVPGHRLMRHLRDVLGWELVVTAPGRCPGGVAERLLQVRAELKPAAREVIEDGTEQPDTQPVGTEPIRTIPSPAARRLATRQADAWAGRAASAPPEVFTPIRRRRSHSLPPQAHGRRLDRPSCDPHPPHLLGALTVTIPAVSLPTPRPCGDRPQLAVRMTSFEVRTSSGDVHTHLVVTEVASAVEQAAAVTVSRYVPGGLQLTVKGGAVLRVLAASTAITRSRPVGTVQVTVLIEKAGDLDDEQLDTLISVCRRVPFTGLEWDELIEQMPLTVGMATQLPSGCLSGVAPVLTVHHMRDFLVMVESIRRLGVPAEAITVLDKGYRYQHTDRVDAHLASWGVRVYPWTEAGEALEDHAARARALGRRGLLIDDGGYTLPVLLDQRPDLLPDFCGLVEQTKSGITKLEPYGDKLPLPLFSVAESRMKAAIEPYGIADAAWRNICRLLPEEKFEGQAAVVIGYGPIGAQIAEVLRQRRMRVAVHDQDITALVTAAEHGFVTHPSLRELLGAHRPLLVVGSTGRTSFTAEHAAPLKRDCYLVSTTSRDREFALPELQTLAIHETDEAQTGFCLRLPQQVSCTVLADGQPVNFHYAESLPNKYSDLVLASLLVGAHTLAQNDHGFALGHNVQLTNQTLATSGLLERYYARFGPQEEV